MIRLLKEIYLTSFVMIVKLPSRRGNTFGKIGGAIAAITLVEWFNLVNFAACIDLLLGKKIWHSFPKLAIAIAFLALFLLNQYILFIRGHGIKFEREFNNLKKSRKVLLITSCVLVILATIAFSIYSTLAYRRFIGVDGT